MEREIECNDMVPAWNQCGLVFLSKRISALRLRPEHSRVNTLTSVPVQPDDSQSPPSYSSERISLWYPRPTGPVLYISFVFVLFQTLARHCLPTAKMQSFRPPIPA